MGKNESFNGLKEGQLRLAEVAERFSVSDATVRNWVKTGALESICKGWVSLASVERFAASEVGLTRLVIGANKLRKTHKGNIVPFVFDNRPTAELIHDYELSLTETYRNREGLFYTPKSIAADMLSEIADVKNKTFLDPCCGCGSFVAAAIEKGFRPENIYACDIDETAVAITRRRIFEMTGYWSEQVLCDDFLDYRPQTDMLFDCIFTNPPWGKKLSNDVKKRYVERFATNRGIDTCALFFLAALEKLRQGGDMGFLLPEAFFNITRFQQIRQLALTHTFVRLIDYGRVFKSLITRAQALVLRKQSPSEKHQVVCVTEAERYKRKQSDFNGSPKHVINFWANGNDTSVVKRVFSERHIKLKGNAQWAMGIVTGNNARHCLKAPKKGYEPVYRGKDVSFHGFAHSGLYIRSDLAGCQQAAPLTTYKAKEKLVYRFIANRLVFYCDRTGKLILNSANLLILNDDFPISGVQLADLLNSDFMSWMHKTLFRMHKILRSDLEELPLPVGYFAEYRDFDEAAFLRYLKVEKYFDSYRISND